MSYDLTKERLISFLYDELPAKEREAVAKQLAASPESQKVLNEMKDTMRTLQVWQDEDPKLDLVFVQQRVPFWQFQMPEVLKRRRRLIGGLTAGLAAAALIISFLNFDTTYFDGTFQLEISLHSKPAPGPESDSLVARVPQQGPFETQEHSVVNFQELLRLSEFRQQENFNQTLLHVIHDLDVRRQQDFRAMGKRLEDVDLTSEVRFRQTDALLQQLFRLTNVRPMEGMPQRLLRNTQTFSRGEHK